MLAVTFSALVLLTGCLGSETGESTSGDDTEHDTTEDPAFDQDSAAFSVAGCGSGKAAIVKDAMSSAKQYTQEAFNYLSTTPPGNTTRWKDYFGTYSLARWNTVEANYKKMVATFNESNVEVLCDCNKTWNGYVVPSDSKPYSIHVCSGFWTESKVFQARTLIHEMSHFTAVEGTVDSHVEPIACAYRYAGFAADAHN
jgi:hypothetical protein